MRKVAINGLGRIGRMALRHLLQVPQVQVVAVNDCCDAQTLAHLVTHDSTHRSAGLPATADGTLLRVGGQAIKVFQEPDPGRIPFGALGAELVLECTGRFTRRDQAAAHLREGVGRVLVSAPSQDADCVLVPGANESAFEPSRHAVVSAGCGTSHAAAPLLRVLDETCGLAYGFLTTVHSYTSEQRILDLPHADLRQARAAALSMIPTSTEAAGTLARALPHLAGRLDALEVRVPTPDVSLVDLTATLASDATLQDLQRAFHNAARSGPRASRLEILEAELVSADLVGRESSCLYDPFLTKRVGPRMVKVFAWFDNEWAYSARLRDLCLLLLGRA